MRGKDFIKDLEHLKSFVSMFRKKYDLSLSQLTSLVDEIPDNNVPLFIFLNEDLGYMELLVTYLKDFQNQSIPEISKILNRAEGSLWASYYSAQKKQPPNFKDQGEKLKPILEKLNISEITIPLQILSERDISIFQSVVLYIKNNFNLKNIQISKLLNKDSQTIWSAINNATKKLDAKLDKRLEERSSLYNELEKRGE